MTDLDLLCEKLRRIDPGIMSLTVSDTNGNILAHSHGSEYEQKYLESAAGVRQKAGLFTAVTMGMQEQRNEIFGETEAVVMFHSKAKIIAMPFPSRTKFLTMLAKKEVSLSEVITKIRLLLEEY